MYFDTDSNISSLATEPEFSEVSYCQVLESLTELTESWNYAEQAILKAEFSRFKLGTEAAGGFLDSVATFFRKILELIKNLAAKIAAYIKTIPTRIANFVRRVANWAAKAGLEARIKTLNVGQNRKAINPAAAKDFDTTTFGPMSWDEVIIDPSVSDDQAEVKKLEEVKEAIGPKQKALPCILRIFPILQKIIPAYGKAAQNLKIQSAAPAEPSRTDEHNAAQAANQHGADKLTVAVDENDQKLYSGYLGAIDAIASALNAERTPKDMGCDSASGKLPDTMYNLFKTVTNGSISKAGDSVVREIDRLKRMVDSDARVLNATWQRAYSAKDEDVLSELKKLASNVRDWYSLLIKIGVRVDTVSSKITANVIKFCKLGLTVYTTKGGNPDADAVPTPDKADEKSEDKASADSNPAGMAGATPKSVKAGPAAAIYDTDFSRVFDF